MADSLVPENDLPAAPQASVAPASEVPPGDLPEVPENDLPEAGASPSKEETYGGGMQQAIAGLEGAAQGVAGPLATYAEKHFLGVPEEDIAGRAEANPWTHGISEGAGLVGGALVPGLGEYSLGAKIAEGAGAAAKIADFGKIGTVALKGAIEGGLFQASDEASKYILDKGDPEAPVSSALAHIGGATLLGGAGGALIGKGASKLSEIAEGKTAQKATQLMADFGNRFEFLTKNKDIPMAATEEASGLWDAIDNAHSETWGNSGLKAQAIEKLVPEMNQKIASQQQEIATSLQNKYSEMIKDPDTYPPRLAKLLQKDINQWMEVATSPEASSFDHFNATQDLKQKLQAYSKFDKQITAIAPERGFIDLSKEIGHELRTSLENPEVWGKAGELQQGINKAFSELKPFQDDFLRSFSTKKLGAPEIDPDKIASVLRQVGRDKGALRGSKLADFIEPAQKFLKKVDDLHSSLGVENSVSPISTDVLNEMLSGKKSAGSKMADWLYGGGPKSIGMAAAHTIGGVGGSIIGGPAGGYLGYRATEHLAPILEEGIGRKLTRSGVAGVLKALSSGNHEGVPQAIHYAESIGKGAKNINAAVDNVFQKGGQQYLNHDFSDVARENLKKYVAEGTLNQQIENQKNQGQDQAATPPAQNFAHGGEVIAPEPTQPVKKPVSPVLKGTDHISAVFPEQSMLLGAAKGRINNYLNSIRPQKIQAKFPFDEEVPDKAKEKSYHRALDLANKPLSVMDHIKNGTLDPEHMQHMSQLYPELTGHLQKKLTEKIVKAQMDNEKPPYKVRQALSLFLGAPMDSTFTPQNIQAAQASFILKNQGAPQGGGKGNPSKLKDMPGQYRTADQARQVRQNRPK